MKDIIVNKIKECIKEDNLSELIGTFKAVVMNDDYEVIALCSKIAHLTTSLEPSNNQLYTAYQMYKGKVIEMPTGDGKTLSGLITLLAWIKTGKTATYLTANSYLAKRDYEFFKGVMDLLELNTVLLSLDTTEEEILNANLIVSDGTVAITYFLVQCKDAEKKYFLTDCVLVDEFDTILIDGASEPAKIAKDVEYDNELFDKVYTTTEEFKDTKVDSKLIEKVLDKLGMQFVDYIKNTDYLRDMILECLDAWNKKLDKDYIVDKKAIVVLDAQGRRTNKGYSRFLQLAIEKRNGLELSTPKEIMVGMSFEGLLSLYEGVVSGMSGTLSTEAKYIEDHYSLDLEVLESEVPSKRRVLEDILIMNGAEEMKNEIVKKTKLYLKHNNPILIFTSDIPQSEAISIELTKAGLPHKLLNAKNAEQEAEIIKKAGKKNAITIMTTMAGRGTDIVVDDECKKTGGLVILSADHLATERLDMQLIGRTGRRGDPGVVQFFSGVNLSANETKIIELASKMSLEEAQYKLRDMVRDNLAYEQNLKEKNMHKTRDYLSCYYKVIDSQIIALQKSKNNLIDMSAEEFEGYILATFNLHGVSALLNLTNDLGKDTLLKLKAKTVKLITDKCCKHYSVLMECMKSSNVLRKDVNDNFSNFQKMAEEQYEQLMYEYKNDFIKLLVAEISKPSM